MKRFGIVNLLLVALIGLAAWRLVDVLRRTPPDIPPDSVASRLVGGDVPGPARRPPVDPVLRTIREKDLFDISRKPPSAEAAEPTPVNTPAPPPTLKLSGVIFVGNFREAVVIDEAQGRKQLRLREGEEISGYRVTSIERERVELRSSQGEAVQLQLLVNTGAPAVQRGPGGGATPRAKAIAKKRDDREMKGGEDPRTDIEKRRADARKRAKRARERLKRLREEAARRK